MKNWKGFERDVAKAVVKTFADHGITNKDCFRTPQSGGHLYARQTDPGDLVISSKLRKLFPCHVECKAWASIRMDQFLVPVSQWKKSWNCRKWLAQMDEAAVDGLIPLLVFKENNGATLAAFPVDVHYGFSNAAFQRKMSFWYQKREWNVVRFEAFLRKMRDLRDRESELLRNRNRGQKEKENA